MRPMTQALQKLVQFFALVFMASALALGTAHAAKVEGNATMTAFGSATPVSAQGATVRLCLTQGGGSTNCFFPLQTQIVGENGTYSLNSNVGTFVLQAIFFGSGLMHAELVTFTDTDQTLLRNLHLVPIPYNITGNVSGGGANLSGATVELSYPGETRVLLSATTNASGNYTLTKVPNGNYDIRAKPPTGLHYTTHSIDGFQIDNASKSQNFVLDPDFSLAGTVTAGGMALAGAQVRLYSAGSGSATGGTPLQTATANTLGNYSLASVPAGNYDLEVQAPVGTEYGMRRITGIPVSANGDVFDVMLHKVSGDLTNADTGAVVPGATVQICDANGCEVSVIASLLADTNGRYVWANPPEGSWLLSIVVDGYTPKTLSLVTAGADLEYDIALAPFKGFTGKVMAGGSPVAGATVKLYLAGTNTFIDTATTDASGTYKLWNPEGGVYDVAATPPTGSSYKAGTLAQVQYTFATRVDHDFVLSTTGNSLSGKVTGDGTGGESGLSGATVKLMNGATLINSAVTNASGNYTIAGITAGTYHVVVMPPSGSAYAYAAFRAVEIGTAIRGNTQINARLTEASGTLSGFVSNLNTGALVGGAKVEICLPANCNDGTSPPVVVSTLANAAGEFSLSQLPLGIVGVRISADGYRTHGESLGLNEVSVHREFQIMQVFSVSGTVTGGGQPLAGAQADIYYAGSVNKVGGVITNASGQYLVGDLLPGVYDLVVTPLSGSAYFRTVVTGIALVNSSAVRNVAAQGVVSGAARYSVKGKVSATGFPAVADVTVKLYPSGQAGSGSVHPLAEGVTDASGNYQLAVAPYGTYEMQVLAPHGSAFAHQLVTGVVVNSSGTTRDIVIPVSPANVTGTISASSTGIPLAGASVDICAVSGTGGCGSILTTVTTDELGAFQALQLAPGEWVLRARGEGYVEKTSTFTLVGTNLVINQQLEKANTLSGTVLAGEGVLPGSRVSVSGTGAGMSAIAGTDGKFQFTQLPSGTYRIVVEPPEGNTEYKVTTVNDVAVIDEDVEIDIAMEEKQEEVSGEVTDENGEPVPDALVQLCEAAVELCTEPIAETTTGPNGGYTLPVGEGDYCLHITAPGKPKQKVCFYSGGEAPVDVDCTLALVHDITGKIFGNRLPVAGVKVQVYVPGELVPLFTAVSGANGSYTLPNLADGIYDLVVTPPAGTPYVRSIVPGIVVSAAQVVQDIVLMVMSNAYATVQGKVVDEDGTPLPGVQVGAWHTGLQGGLVPMDADISALDGSYRLRVPADTYRLSLVRHDFEFENYVTGLNAEGTVTRDIVVPMVNISGSVTVAGSGQAAPGTRIEFEGGGVGASVTADAAGSYSLRLPAFAYGARLVPAAGSGHGLKVISFLPKLEQDGIRHFEMEAPVYLGGIARDLAGRVLPNTGVVVRDQATGFHLLEARTDASGRYQFTKLAPGLLNLSVYGEGYSLPGRFPSVALPSGGLMKDLEIPLIYVAGVIRDLQGNPVAGARITNNIVWNGGHVQQTRTTGADGRYQFRMLAYNNHAFELQPPSALLNLYGKSVVSGVSLLADNFNNDLTLGQLLQLQGTLRDQLGAVLAGKKLRFGTLGQHIGEVLTDASGNYSIKLVAANYGVNVSTSQFQASLPSVSLTANLTKNLQLTLHDFTGRVIDVNGVAVAGVTIKVQESLYHSGGTTQVQLQTNLAGEFSVRLPPSNVNCIVQPKTLSGLLSIYAPSISLNGNIERHFVLHRADLRAPVIISKPTVTGLTQGAAVIGWETDELASTQVVVNGQTFSVPGFRTLHSVAVSGLAAQTAYTATVSSSDPSGNGPTTDTVAFTTLAVPDTTAPLLLNGPIVSAITHNSVTIDWTTDEAATTKLVYGIGTPTQSVTVNGLRSAHQVDLTDLAANTDYVLRVEAVDAAGNGPVQSAIVTFRTAQAPDTRVPVIVAGPVITNVTDTSVTVAWQTDEPANSGVSLMKGEEREAVNDSALVTQHEVTVTGLTAESVYTLVVSSTDGAGNGPVLSPEITFTTLATPDTQGPVFVESLRVVGITHKSAVVQWRTDEVANSTVEFGTSSTTLNRVASDAKLKTQHIVHLTDLAINTEYFIRARSVDAQGNESVSTIGSFRTRNHPDAAAPVFTAVPTVIGNTDKTATLAWETSEPADYVVTWGANAIDENVISDGKRKQKQRVTLTNLEPGVSYSFAVTVSDGSGNSTRYESIASVGALTRGSDGFSLAMSALGVGSANASGGGTGGFLASLLADTTAPAFVTAPAASWLSNDRVLLGWVTNEPVSVQVSYGLASSTERRLAGVLIPSLLHSVVLTGLQSGGNYAFDVTIRDIAGNVTTSSGTFIARSLADLLAPVVSTLTVSDRAAGSVFVNLVTDEPVMHEVRFGLSSTTMYESVHSLAYDKLQVLTLTGLVDGSTYYYQVISEDAAGNRVVSAVRSFIAGAAGVDPGTLAALIMKLAGQVADKILVGAQNLVVSLNEAVLPKPVEDYVVRWYFDGVHIPALDGMIDAEIPSHLLTSGSHTMRAELTDTTVSHLSTLRLSQRVTVQPPPVVITPDLSAFENARVVIMRNGVEISSAPQGATDITIRIDGYTPAPGANHTLRWYLDGVHRPEFDNMTSGVAPFNPLAPGKHTIRLEMTDNAAPTLVTARTSKVVAVSPGSGGGALDAGLLLLLLAGGLRLRQRRKA